MPSSFLPGAGPETWKHSLSGPSPSLTASETGAQQPLEFAWVTQVMEWKLRPGLLWKKQISGKAPVPPSKPTWPSLDSTVLHGGALPHPQPHHQVFGDRSAAAAPPRTSGQRTTVWDPSPPLQALCRMVAPWLARTKQGKDLGPASGVTLVPVPPLLADTGLSDTRVCVYLLPLVPDSLANPMAPVSGGAGQKKKPRSGLRSVSGLLPTHACIQRRPHRATSTRRSVENASLSRPSRLTANAPYLLVH